ncbi:uncharacterized protein RhoGAP54D [Chelonus insularis]|uniref:uncharacterized protein RhoGAP54D n=1 Tax=Chelonus insularis TaxID=460826 RepID=UPI00158BB2CB|nr:uncharacterized protein LOC118072404 [Chelonus insularis]
MEDFNNGVDGKLASRMRRVNPEQFFTLVRMHLSFELDINTEDNELIADKAKLKKWGLINFSKKPKSTMNLQHKESEMGSLTTEGINQVKQLIEYLSRDECLNQEGIFRRTGKLTRQQELKNSLYQGLPLNLNEGIYSVHDCASVLKGFLADLPEPLLTELHYPAHCQIAELCSIDSNANESRLLGSMQLLLLLLPPVNRILLKYLLNLLNKTAALESSNKMNCDTLATLFTPHLMCPRKLSPEALHINSQNLSGLVSFMIRKDQELFDIPTKLATDIRAYWVDKERKLLSPNKKDLNESISDTTGTAHTVYSFVDHKLTAKANSTEDTQAALAQLYAHIQAMPESAKKRRLVKQFNKENGQGTPRHIKQVRTKSLGDSIKKHIFQKKILSNKKLVDINICSTMNRSSSEENLQAEKFKKASLSSKKLFSKSDDELSMDSFGSFENGNLINSKHISNSTGSINSPIGGQKEKKKILMNFIDRYKDRDSDTSGKSPKKKSSTPKNSSIGSSKSPKKVSSKSIEKNKTVESNKLSLSDITNQVRRYNSESAEMYSSPNSPSTIEEDESVDQESGSYVRGTIAPNFKIIFTPSKSLHDTGSGPSRIKALKGSSPSTVNKPWYVRGGTHTSTPSDLLRRNLASNEYGLTPIANSDKSMSPITQSTSKMTKAMQETMMTPRSRKPVMMVSGTNLCNLASLKNGNNGENHNRFKVVNINIDEDEKSHTITLSPPKSQKKSDKRSPSNSESRMKNREDQNQPLSNRHLASSIEDDGATLQPSCMSITSTFKEYLLSRSVLTASPVDLSFTSRTGDDFEQSESEMNDLEEEEGITDSLLRCLDGNNPSSDTSGIASGSTNSADNSAEKIDDVYPSPRKRGTNLQRNDSKRSAKNSSKYNKSREGNVIKRQGSESTSDSENTKDTFQETSF